MTALLVIICILSIAVNFILFTLYYKTEKRLKSIFSDDSFSIDLETVISNLEKQKKVLDLNFSAKDINQSKSLSDALREIVYVTYEVFNPKYVELELKDSETESYHSAFSLGTPVSVDGGSKKYKELIEPILFSGNNLGQIRLVLDIETLLSSEDIRLFQLLSLQSGISILNAEYSKEVLRLKSASEESVKAKTGFLANLSHELRGPLGVMLSAVEITLDGMCGEVSDAQRKTLGMIEKNGNHLLDLVNDVLDYAKIEAGKVTPKTESINANDLLNDIAKLLNSQIIAKHHSLEIRESKDLVYFSCDRRHSRQILINLMTNAIKYTQDRGSIILSAKRLKGGKVKISVEDNGVGIPEDQRDKVFSAFQRVEHGYSIKQVGTGLGMPLTKKLAEVNHGSVHFNSVEKEGSTFWVQFEECEADEIDLDKEEDQKRDAKGHGQKVVIVDPDTSTSELYKTYLENIGFNISLFNSMENIDTNDVDLIIIDNSLVDHSDDSFLNTFRAKFSKPQIPIVLLTSKAFEFDVEHYLRIGVDICLSKPLSLKELGHKIEELL